MDGDGVIGRQSRGRTKLEMKECLMTYIFTVSGLLSYIWEALLKPVLFSCLCLVYKILGTGEGDGSKIFGTGEGDGEGGDNSC